MKLLQHQAIANDKIIEAIATYDQPIMLKGRKGTGKTSLLTLLVESYSSKELWGVYYIDGDSLDYEPFSTISSRITEGKEHIKFGFEAGVNLLFISFGINAEKKSQDGKNIAEKLILEELNKNIREKILIVADHINHWDKQSLLLILSLIKRNSKKEFPDKDIHFLICFDDDDVPTKEIEEILLQINFITVSIGDVTSGVVREFISIIQSESPPPEAFLMEIVGICGKDLNIVKFVLNALLKDICAAAEGKIGESTEQLAQIIENRIVKLEQVNQHVRSFLESASIFSMNFDENDVSAVIKNSFDKEDILKAIFLCVQNALLLGENRYKFSCAFIRDYFYQKLGFRKRYLHEKYYAHITKLHPEKYRTRLWHLHATDDIEYDRMILSLLFTSLAQGYERSPDVEDTSNRIIEHEINDLLETSCSTDHLRMHDFTNAIHGLKLFHQGDYENSLKKLSAIIEQYSLLFYSEILLLKILANERLSDRYEKRKELLNDFYAIAERLKFEENELWTRISIVVSGIVSAKLNDLNMSKNIALAIKKNSFDAPNSEFKRKASAIMARKSSLYFPPEISIGQCEASVQYFKKTHDIIQLYMSLCNLSGNAMVCGKFSTSMTAINECIALASSWGRLHFHDYEKVENNKILSEYFLSKSILHESNFIEESINNICEKYIQMEEKYTDASKGVVSVNLLSFLSLANRFDEADERAEYLKKWVEDNNDNDFYGYYLENYYWIKCLHNQDIEGAKIKVKILANNIPSLYNPYALAAFQKRHQRMESITIKNIKEHRLIDLEDRLFVAVPEINLYWSFLGRIFLFSDLQFLSM